MIQQYGYLKARANDPYDGVFREKQWD